jgi:lipopolysaccharide transport system ATP-binding protein
VIGRHTVADEFQYWWHKFRGRDPRDFFGKIGHTATERRRVEAEREGHQEFWALKGVSFEVQPGEVVGIIGGNGAGKSTLLKILTRITEPTSGEARIHGRVASLLEVGTGFHPELTGRENVYMNGTILGMKKREIDAKFDEIVAFSELERFVDTPVKRYSSGMYVRLAFAVAAHLDPEIMLVDEVLAVGDAAFQKKCLGKMGDVAKEGRTVLFVSHNMTSLLNLCTRGLLLSHGEVSIAGGIEEVVAEYLGGREAVGSVRRPDDAGKDWCIRSLAVGEGGRTIFRSSSVLDVHIACSVHRPVRGAQLSFEMRNQNDECIFSTSNQDFVGNKEEMLPPGDYEWTCRIPLGMYRAGRYSIEVNCSVPCVRWLDQHGPAVSFHIQDDTSPIHQLGQNRRGFILPVYEWQVQPVVLPAATMPTAGCPGRTTGNQST